jgi:hypothetical protein
LKPPGKRPAAFCCAAGWPEPVPAIVPTNTIEPIGSFSLVIDRQRLGETA